MKTIINGLATVAACAIGISAATAPARADVKAGYDAWNQGDYPKAVAQWRPLAETGDADAQFNMGQAYKMGNGVPPDDTIAMEWFRRAAAQGHPRAIDNYGRMLFQAGKRAEAIPYIEKSAALGKPRSQYILATALFNGEYESKDWVRAYALMTRAASAGLQPAAQSLEQMNIYIPADQRQQGLAMAAQLETQEKAAVLAADTQMSKSVADTAPTVPAKPAPKPVKASDVRAPEKPAIKPAGPVKAVSAKPVPVAAPAKGDWRVQLGAFSEDGRAKSQWKTLSGKVRGLAAYTPYYIKAGTVTRLLAGPLASSGDAEKLCGKIKAAGSDCLPKKM
jgi:cell division septation protein DedD